MFCAAVRDGTRLKDWNTKPNAARRSLLSASSFRLPRSTSPRKLRSPRWGGRARLHSGGMCSSRSQTAPSRPCTNPSPVSATARAGRGPLLRPLPYTLLTADSRTLSAAAGNASVRSAKLLIPFKGSSSNSAGRTDRPNLAGLPPNRKPGDPSPSRAGFWCLPSVTPGCQRTAAWQSLLEERGPTPGRRHQRSPGTEAGKTRQPGGPIWTFTRDTRAHGRRAARRRRSGHAFPRRPPRPPPLGDSGGQAATAVVAVNALGWLGTGTAVYILVAAVTGSALGFAWLAGSYTAGYLIGFVTDRNSSWRCRRCCLNQTTAGWSSTASATRASYGLRPSI